MISRNGPRSADHETKAWWRGGIAAHTFTACGRRIGRVGAGGTRTGACRERHIRVVKDTVSSLSTRFRKYNSVCGRTGPVQSRLSGRVSIQTQSHRCKGAVASGSGSLPLVAQNPTSALVGAVTDNSGAVIPNAVLKVSNLARTLHNRPHSGWLKVGNCRPGGTTAPPWANRAHTGHATPPTSPPVRGTSRPSPDSRPGFFDLDLRHSGGNGRFMLPAVLDLARFQLPT